MKFTCDKCGWELFAESVMMCPRCKDTGEWTRHKPEWVKWVEKRRNETDRGVGDTAQRIFAKLGGELFKKLAAFLGMPCGCNDRQDEWNALWPYPCSITGLNPIAIEQNRP